MNNSGDDNDVYASRMSRAVARLARRRLAEAFIAEHKLVAANDAGPAGALARPLTPEDDDLATFPGFLRALTRELEDDSDTF